MPRLVMLMAGLGLAGCSPGVPNQSDPTLAAVATYGGAPVQFELGDRIYVEGVLRDFGNGGHALYLKTGTGDYASWHCVVLRDTPALARVILPTGSTEEPQRRFYSVVGRAVEGDVRGNVTPRHGQYCFVAIDVERISAEPFPAEHLGDFETLR